MLKFGKIFIVLFLSLFIVESALGQEIVDFEEDRVVRNVKKRREVEITVNGKPFQIRNYIELQKGKILDVHIEGFKPNSTVVVKLQKLGTKIKNAKIKANHLGVIDLEIRLPKQKSSGSATVVYYTSDGRKHSRDIKVKIK